MKLNNLKLMIKELAAELNLSENQVKNKSFLECSLYLKKFINWFC